MRGVDVLRWALGVVILVEAILFVRQGAGHLPAGHNYSSRTWHVRCWEPCDLCGGRVEHRGGWAGAARLVL
jgi:hypothetical protein